MKASALLIYIKKNKLKKEFHEHKQQKENQKPIDKIMGIEKQRIKIIKALIYSMLAGNCQSKNPHFS